MWNFISFNLAINLIPREIAPFHRNYSIFNEIESIMLFVTHTCLLHNLKVEENIQVLALSQYF